MPPIDPYEHVRCELFLYSVTYVSDNEVQLPTLRSLVVGPKGIRLPLDADFLKELPAALIAIWERDGVTPVQIPQTFHTYQFEMERHLAERKGFKING